MRDIDLEAKELLRREKQYDAEVKEEGGCGQICRRASRGGGQGEAAARGGRHPISHRSRGEGACGAEEA
ncbi:hypothetical protein J2T14_001706 [Paenibacillus harenae]|nr:hypothetical protein [Paenibacillus harenae]